MADDNNSSYNALPPLPVPPGGLPQLNMHLNYPTGPLQIHHPRYPPGHRGFAHFPRSSHNSPLLPQPPFSHCSQSLQFSSPSFHQLQQPVPFFHSNSDSVHDMKYFTKKRWGSNTNDHKKWKRGGKRQNHYNTPSSNQVCNGLIDNPWKSLMTQEEELKHYKKLASRFPNEVSMDCKEVHISKHSSDKDYDKEMNEDIAELLILGEDSKT